GEVGLLGQVVNALGREALDGFGQAPGEIGRLHRLWNLRFALLGRVQDERLVLDQRPFNGPLRAVHVDALAILARGVEQAADDAGIDVGALELDVRRLDGEARAVVLDEFQANRAGTEATHVFRRFANQPGDRPDTMRGVPHGRQAGPVIGPAVHVLLVTGLDELELAEFARVEQLLHEQVFAGVNDRLGHHVFEPGLLDEFDDLPAVADARGHRHGAGDMFAGFEGGDG